MEWSALRQTKLGKLSPTLEIQLCGVSPDNLLNKLKGKNCIYFCV